MCIDLEAFIIVGGKGPDIGQNILTPRNDVEIVDLLTSGPRLTDTPGSLPEESRHIDGIMVGGLVGEKPLVMKSSYQLSGNDPDILCALLSLLRSAVE